jgi:hypothetical protein
MSKVRTNHYWFENGFSPLHEENRLIIAIGLWWERKVKEKKGELKSRDKKNWGNKNWENPLSIDFVQAFLSSWNQNSKSRVLLKWISQNVILIEEQILQVVEYKCGHFFTFV